MPRQESRDSHSSDSRNRSAGSRGQQQAGGRRSSSDVERLHDEDDEVVHSQPYAEGKSAGPQVTQDDGGGVDSRSRIGGQSAAGQDSESYRAGSQRDDVDRGGRPQNPAEGSSRDGKGQRTRDDRHGGSSRQRGIH